jgi:CheY-like chemotaxis protein/DNA-directed RNA polymerase specialized sigma24 family protein
MRTAGQLDMAGIAGAVPFLRRYGRALTGTQTEGDELVRSALRWLGEHRDRLEGLDTRVALYRALHEVLGSAAVPAHGPEPHVLADEAIVDARVRDLPPYERAVLLLTVLEGFSNAEAALVLGLSTEEAEAYLETAREHMKRQAPSRVLVIEDEPVIAMDLIGTITASGHSVVGVARTRTEATQIAERIRPDVVIADIQLADASSGLDAVQDILRFGSLPVVFVTSFPEELLRGDRVEPTFVVTKPFNPDTLVVSIAQALATAGTHPVR